MRQFHDVRNTKKALAYGAYKGMGPFRRTPKPKGKDATTPSEPRKSS